MKQRGLCAFSSGLFIPALATALDSLLIPLKEKADGISGRRELTLPLYGNRF